MMTKNKHKPYAKMENESPTKNASDYNSDEARGRCQKACVRGTSM